MDVELNGQVNFEKELRQPIDEKIREVFGYSKQFYDLSKKYRINIEKINYIVNKYRTMENFINVYRLGKLDEEDYTILRDNIRRYIDIRLNDNIGFDILIRDILEKYNTSSKHNILIQKEFMIYDSDIVRDIINREIRKRDSDMMKDKYGLEDGVYKDDEYIKEKMEISAVRVWKIKKNVLTQLVEKKIIKIFLYASIDTSDGAEIQREILEKEFFNSDYIFYPDSEYKSENPNNKHEEVLSEIIKDFNEKGEGQENGEQIDGKRKIGSLNISVWTYNALYKAGITTVEDLENAYADIINHKVIGLGEKCKKEVTSILKRRKSKIETTKSEAIENLNFSKRVYKALKKIGINTTEDLARLYLKYEMDNIPVIGAKSITEIILKLKERNIIQFDVQEESELEQLKEQKRKVESRKKALQQTAKKAKKFVKSYDMTKRDVDDVNIEQH